MLREGDWATTTKWVGYGGPVLEDRQQWGEERFLFWRVLESK